jgi:pimeloyl-ACP methyl ester carboxylesterase
MTISEGHTEHGGYRTAYLTAGQAGPPIVLIHGSGPGVSARANWQGTMQSSLADERRLFAPDVVGFGGTERTLGGVADHAQRVDHVVSFIRHLDVGPVDLVGNSMGGALALAVAVDEPTLVRSLILMGTAGCQMAVSPGLEKVWGYTPSPDAMEELIDVFAYDSSFVTPELIDLRFRASTAPGVHERYAASFGPPFQPHADEMALPDDVLVGIEVPTLMFHGRNDIVIPLETTSLRLVDLLPNAQLVVFSRCGHWTQIERAADFVDHVSRFLRRLDE